MTLMFASAVQAAVGARIAVLQVCGDNLNTFCKVTAVHPADYLPDSQGTEHLRCRAHTVACTMHACSHWHPAVAGQLLAVDSSAESAI